MASRVFFDIKYTLCVQYIQKSPFNNMNCCLGAVMIARRLFVVLLADNNHGKTTMIKSLVEQGLRRSFKKLDSGNRKLVSPTGRFIDALIFGRSYQETEKANCESVISALNKKDNDWWSRELIIMPSHVTGILNSGKPDDVDEMVEAAHGAGFDAICVSVILSKSIERKYTSYSDIWIKDWDERWTLQNKEEEDPKAQLEALGHDLWTWISKAITRQ